VPEPAFQASEIADAVVPVTRTLPGTPGTCGPVPAVVPVTDADRADSPTLL
jgi:hypothetical protein